MPGYGLNFQRLLIPYNLQIVTIAVAQHIPANCILIGWSLGGLVAQQIAHSYPEKLKQMVLICSSPKFSKSADWPSIEPKVLSFFTQQLNIGFSKTLERFLAIQAMGSVNARCQNNQKGGAAIPFTFISRLSCRFKHVTKY